jgi:hypothetical protein
MSYDSFTRAQKRGGRIFAPLQTLTTVAAARLLMHAGVQAGQRVLDAACLMTRAVKR